ncbi:MAG: DNA-directed RNA polymerase subunit omega [Planctomycetes bacterium]|nr:DNA-directed RNA polymerase subunit omega [Planctomycetota bacterium]
MLDIDLEERLVELVGGKFKLTVLMQKRLVELNRGGAPLVETESKRPVDIVVQEILEGKIELAPKEQVSLTLEEEAKLLTDGRREEDAEGIFGSDLKKIKEQRIKELTELLGPKKA